MSFLDELKKATASENINTLRANTVWARVFDLPNPPGALVIRHFSLMQALIETVELQINSLEALEHELYLKACPKISGGIGHSASGGLATEVRGFFDSEALTVLAFCSERLNQIRPEPSAPPDELEELRANVDALRRQILESGVKRPLKEFLGDLVGAMTRAIHEYQFRGVVGMRAEAFQIFEKLQRGFEEIKEERDNPIVKEFFSIMELYDKSTAAWAKVSPLLSHVQALLPAAGPVLEQIAKSMPG